MTLLPNFIWFYFILLLVFQRIPIGTKPLTVHIILVIHIRVPNLPFIFVRLQSSQTANRMCMWRFCFLSCECKNVWAKQRVKSTDSLHIHFVNLMKCLSSAIHGIITTISTENRYHRRLWPIFNIQARRIECDHIISGNALQILCLSTETIRVHRQIRLIRCLFFLCFILSIRFFACFRHCFDTDCLPWVFMGNCSCFLCHCWHCHWCCRRRCCCHCHCHLLVILSSFIRTIW